MRETLLVLFNAVMLTVGGSFVLYILFLCPHSLHHQGLWKRWRRRNWTAEDWAKVPGRELFPEFFGDRRDDV